MDLVIRPHPNVVYLQSPLASGSML